MNKEQMEAKFAHVKANIKQKWAKLTDNDVMLFNGKQDEFFATLKEKHGIAKEEAQRNIKEFENTYPE